MCYDDHASAVLPSLCTLFASWVLLDSHPFSFLSSTSNKLAPPPPKHCLTAAEDDPIAFSTHLRPPHHPPFHCQCTEYRLSAEHPFVVAWRGWGYLSKISWITLGAPRFHFTQGSFMLRERSYWVCRKLEREISNPSTLMCHFCVKG